MSEQTPAPGQATGNAPAAFLLDAVRAKYPAAAIVPEITIEDEDLPDSGEPTEHLYERTPPPDGHKFSRRIDALMWESLIRTAIEIKVTRSDFMRDTYWKRRAWQRVTHRFVYMVPEGLNVTAPHGCGLWEVDATGRITVVKKAILNRSPEPLPQTVVQRLAYRAGAL